MADFRALDASTFVDGDLDPTFAPISGRRAIAERVLRSWLTRPNQARYAPDRGVGVLDWLSLGSSAADRAALTALLEADAVKDEGVAAASVVVGFNASLQTMTIDATLEDDVGPFPLTLSIDLVSSSLFTNLSAL